MNHWQRANRELLAKAITELIYEGVIGPEISADGALRWPLPSGTLTATARRRTLGWWRVDPESLRWDGGPPPDAVDVLGEGLAVAGCDGATLAPYLAELSGTLLADCVRLDGARPVAELIDEMPVLVEAELGAHPWIIANKGRVGFSTAEARTYPPEARHDVQLHWLAAAPGVADVRGLDHQQVIREQVGDGEFARLRDRAAVAGLDPDTCAYLPVHPWQWTHRIELLYAGDLAGGELAHLGVGTARYRPQLSLRTMTDLDHSERRYLKLPLSILNTSVYRGLPRERTIAAPALTAWLQSVVDGDPFLRATGLVLLGEVASVSIPHRILEATAGVPYQYTETLGAIWREPAGGYLRPGEHAVSLAALLHVDPAGRSFTGTLIERSGLEPAAWFDILHEAVLPPLFHFLYRYGAMFSPTGQNCMLIHRDGVPQRLVVKDFVDDVALCSERLPEHDSLDPVAAAALTDVTISAKTLVKYLHNGLIIGVYRYLAEIADDLLGVPEPYFWASVRGTLARYQQRFAAELGDRFRQFDLETPTFPKLCLNRLRLFERGYGDDPERPVIAPYGEVLNPLSRVDGS
jgi:siderophore synthetase component